MSSRLTSSRLVISTLVAGAIAVLSVETACSSLSLCKSTSRSAAVKILSAWCERYTQCDPKRGTVADCVSERLAIGQYPNEDGCAGTCSEDTECHRSTCSEEKIDKCKTDAFAMKCEEQVQGPLVRYPFGCDSCFN